MTGDLSKERSMRMNVYDLIESCHTREALDDIRTDVMIVIDSCESVEEMKRVQDAFRKQKNRIQRGRYRQPERSSE